MATKYVTKTEVRQIAQEESKKICEESITALKEQIECLQNVINQSSKTLARLERLLLGELGVEENDTLKARTNYAYKYAKRNTDLKIVDRALPALEWFEDMNQKEHGSEESKLDSLGKIINAYTSLKWILGFLGITTVLSLLSDLGILSWIVSLF